MKKIIVFPAGIDLSLGGPVSNLLSSREFSRLRCGFANFLTDEEIDFLMEEFEPFCVLDETPRGRRSVEEDEDISIEMMEEAAHYLTRLEVS